MLNCIFTGITLDAKTFQLAAGCSTSLAARVAPLITAAMNEFDIGTFKQQACFIAQTGHESMGFTRASEIWGPTPAQRAYEGRIDLGNTSPGDGSKYRGYGFIQITGKANILAAGAYFHINTERNPELLATDAYAARTAGWFWKTHGLNAYADRDDFAGLTRKINGGQNGKADREQRWALAKAALGLS